MVRTGVSGQSPEGDGWEHVPNPEGHDVTSVGVGRSGRVWAVTWEGRILVRLGVSRERATGQHFPRYFLCYFNYAFKEHTFNYVFKECTFNYVVKPPHGRDTVGVEESSMRGGCCTRSVLYYLEPACVVPSLGSYTPTKVKNILSPEPPHLS